MRRRGRSSDSRALRTRGGRRSRAFSSSRRFSPRPGRDREGTNPRGWPSRSPPRRRAHGEGAYERVVRELLCADPSTNDDDDDDRVDDDDRYGDVTTTTDAFARTSYAFEFASLFDGRHLAARTVAAPARADRIERDRLGAPRVVGRALIESSVQSGAAMRCERRAGRSLEEPSVRRRRPHPLRRDRPQVVTHHRTTTSTTTTTTTTTTRTFGARR